ncbi:MAG TPA: class I adenylate-forming enzyme family protein [Tepidisphaeraceae bacterium]|jgi:acyl-coenzyme A synthetase/AMP-(fatty) acid ligase|nr:class I adenylate-forming enzyme family protein [Tepidisphaeraceae bacterium]
MNLSDPISQHAVSHADHPAVVGEHRTLSYRELDGLVNSLVLRLTKLGARLGDAIGICLQDRPLYLAAIFAVYRLGGIALSMDWRWTLAEQTKIIRRFGPRLVLAEPSRPRPAEASVVAVDESWESIEGAIDVGAGNDLSDMPATLALSSGTTGEPKAIVTSHAQAQAKMTSFITACGMSGEDRYFSVLPLSFSAGRLFAIANLSLGATVVLAGTFASAREIAEGIVRSRATTTCLVPSVSRAILKLHADSAMLFPDLRTLMSIGAPLHQAERVAIRRQLSPHLLDIYASSGGGLATVIGPAEQDQYPGSVGKAARGVELEMVDDADRPLPRGETGRVRYRGPGMTMGFYKDAEHHDDLRDGWCYPGDFAALNDDGYVFLQGRRSEIVIRGGINVFTPEIERALLAHPSVIEAAAVGVGSENAGEDVVAFVRLGAPLSGRDLIAHCRTVLAAYKVPTRIHHIEALPKNSAGKVLKGELAKLDEQMRNGSAG